MSKYPSVEKELLSVCKMKMGSDRQATLEKITKKINNMTDDDWDLLSAEAQSWFTKAAKAYKAEQDLPDFPSTSSDTEQEKETKEDPPAEEESESADEEEGAGEAPEDTKMSAAKKKTTASSTKKGAAKGTSRRATDKATVKKAASSNARKPTSVPTMIKQLVLKNPEITKDELIEKLSDKGLKCTPLTVAGIRADFRHSIKVLQESDLLKKHLID